MVQIPSGTRIFFFESTFFLTFNNNNNNSNDGDDDDDDDVDNASVKEGSKIHVMMSFLCIKAVCEYTPYDMSIGEKNHCYPTFR